MNICVIVEWQYVFFERSSCSVRVSNVIGRHLRSEILFFVHILGLQTHTLCNKLLDLINILCILCIMIQQLLRRGGYACYSMDIVFDFNVLPHKDILSQTDSYDTILAYINWIRRTIKSKEDNNPIEKENKQPGQQDKNIYRDGIHKASTIVELISYAPEGGHLLLRTQHPSWQSSRQAQCYLKRRTWHVSKHVRVNSTYREL